MSDEIQYELEDNLREEYDLTELKNPVRGKYYQQYRKGHSVTIHHEDVRACLKRGLYLVKG